MNTSILKCEFCQHMTFTTKFNKKRHFLNRHNFAFKKAKTYIPPPTEEPINIGNLRHKEEMEEDEDLPLNVAANQKAMNSEHLEYKDLMEEDEDILLNINIDF